MPTWAIVVVLCYSAAVTAFMFYLTARETWRDMRSVPRPETDDRAASVVLFGLLAMHALAAWQFYCL